MAVLAVLCIIASSIDAKSITNSQEEESKEAEEVLKVGTGHYYITLTTNSKLTSSVAITFASEQIVNSNISLMPFCIDFWQH